MSLRKNFRVLFALQCVLVVGLALLTVALFQNQQRLSRSQQMHLRSYLFADELRQSSDDLTRLARTYVATGDEEYERQYWAVLAVRNGVSPRPVEYNRIYWDFVSASGQKPRPDGETISLRDLMVREGVTPDEFAKLGAAQKYSDALVKTEQTAMNAVKGLFEDGAGNFTVRRAPDRELAIRLLHDASYHRNKAEIMRPIDEFFAVLSERTAGNVAWHERWALFLLGALGPLIIVILGLGGYSFATMRRQITVRERAQVALRQAEELHRVTLQSVGEAVIFTDMEGRVQLMNTVAEALTGWRQLEAHEKPVTTVFRIINETTRQPAESPVEKALREGEVVGLANHTLLLSRDGTERHIADAASPIRDRGNKLLGVVLVFRDQTQERAATQALRESEARLQAILDEAPSPVYVLDLEGRFILVNRRLAALFGRPRTAILGQTRESFLPNEIATAHRANDLEVMRAGQPLMLEEINNESDGRHTYLSCKFPLRGEEGTITSICGISTDITERKRLDAELALREARFRAVFDHAPVGLSLTKGGGIMMVNAAHVRITGVPEADINVPGAFARASQPEDYARQLAAAKKIPQRRIGPLHSGKTLSPPRWPGAVGGVDQPVLQRPGLRRTPDSDRRRRHRRAQGGRGGAARERGEIPRACRNHEYGGLPEHADGRLPAYEPCGGPDGGI